MPALRINHVSVSSPDQDASARFYEELFGVERIPAPNFGFRVDWFKVRRHAAAHLPRGRQGAQAPPPRPHGRRHPARLPAREGARRHRSGLHRPRARARRRERADVRARSGRQPDRDQRARRRLHHRRHPRAQAAVRALPPGPRDRRRPALPSCNDSWRSDARTTGTADADLARRGRCRLRRRCGRDGHGRRHDPDARAHLRQAAADARADDGPRRA